MRLTALHIGIIVAFMAVVVLTYAALTVDYYSWELEFSRWLQGFSLGPADFLRGWLFWMGARGSRRRGGAGGVFSSLVSALEAGGCIRGSGFRAGPAEHPHQGVDRAPSANRRHGGGGHWLRWHTGIRLSQRPRRPCGPILRVPAPFWRVCTYPTRPWCGPYSRWESRTSWLLVRGSSTTVATGPLMCSGATRTARSTCWR